MHNGSPSAPRPPRYVTDKDLAFFQYRVEQEGEIAGASGWDLMLDKHINGQLKYQAWRRTLPVSVPARRPRAPDRRRWAGCAAIDPDRAGRRRVRAPPRLPGWLPHRRPPLLQDGKTEYKSVTISHDSTAEEIMDIYLDDNFRPQWVRGRHGRRRLVCMQPLALRGPGAALLLACPARGRCNAAIRAQAGAAAARTRQQARAMHVAADARARPSLASPPACRPRRAAGHDDHGA
jgi:hypothetical protein